MSKQRSTSPRVLVALSVVAGAAAVGAGVVYARGRRTAAKSAEPTMWTCQCGQAFRVNGQGRHRLYWLPDAEPGDPVLGDSCPSCEQPLPSGQGRLTQPAVQSA